ncbi:MULTISPECIES: vWA domain-containing protein [unclassified Crossiella]|uniref:vWA domain-containing protein n=1 Tax=unclassified Crossiella TaxID=2620835 RepID=UPI001FFFB952|nr:MULTISPECIES: vWA domain-containing protein [unclassified Crossiella]MCK2243807.1 VWA domain-containing protein [Crossiella sp. S99.2]MCK2257666.1 VWA domain-containing protein [Crossiella sp. S99.1]
MLCIDVTGSMGALLHQVKDSALSFHKQLAMAMDAKGRRINQLRIRIVAFRDFGELSEKPVEQTGFLAQPEQAAELEHFVRGLTPTGGGDAPESGLEALTLAMDSPWESGFDRRRHVIVLFTDAPAHPLGRPEHVRAPGYPRIVPRTMRELFDRWGYGGSQGAAMDNNAKRLLLFAPEVTPWTDIADGWNNTIYFPSTAGEGLEEWEMDEIVNTIANSI